MKAIQIKQYGGEDQLEMVEVSKPRAGAGQLVVRWRLCRIQSDRSQASIGRYAPGFPTRVPDRAEVRKGETVLIHGAGGAVGSVAVQIAHQRGANVTGTASARSLERIKGYGADRALDYAGAPFESRVEATDAVLDTVGGEVQNRSYAVLKQGGTLVAINQPPSEEEAGKHHVKASFLVTDTSTASRQKVAAMIDDGTIKPFVGKVYPLANVAQAWRDAESSKIEGKIIFAVGA